MDTPDKISLITCIATIVSSGAAVFALIQIRIAKEALRKTAAAQMASEATRQCERYIDRFLPMFRHLEDRLLQAGFVPPARSLAELLKHGSPGMSSKEADFYRPFLERGHSCRDALLDCLNHLEILAMTFDKSLADKSVAFKPLVFSFCRSVDVLGGFAVLLRESVCSLMYSNLIRVYEKWQPTVVHELASYQDRLDKL